MKKSVHKIMLQYALLGTLMMLNMQIAPEQTFPVDTVLFNGDPSKFINFVFIGDGFQSSEMGSYSTNVQALTNYLFNITPFKEYRNYFNVFAVEVPSVESGADHPRTAPDCPPPASHPLLVADTYFNSSFDQNSIHRLLVPLNGSAIFSVLINNFPMYDQKLVLVNSPYYGGSGGSNATASLNSSSFEIMAHEIGHSFANLADEYWAGDGYAGERVNMTQQTDPLLVKWKNWMGYNGVGIYQHCCGGTSANWYRPHQGCKMRYLGTGYPFCAVCREAIVEMVHARFGTPILAHAPVSDTTSYCGLPLTFGISAVKPDPNTLRVIWTLNGDTIVKNNDSITVSAAQLLAGSNGLSVIVMDTSALTRSDNHFLNNVHTYTLYWTILHDTLPAPYTIPAGNAEICQGDSLLLSASAGSAYLWSNGLTGQNIAVSAAGSYTVTITNAIGCTDSAPPVSISVNPLPPAAITAGGPAAFCQGDSVTLCAGQATSYLWNDNSVLQCLEVFSGGTYSVTVTDSNGCSAVSAPETVVVHPLPYSVITPGGTIDLCQGDSAVLTVAATGTYLWNAGGSTQSITVTAPGSYEVTVTDSNGCSSAATPVNVAVHALPAVPVITANGTTLTSDAAVGNQWFLNGNPVTGATFQSYVLNQNGSYVVCVTDSNACTSCSAPYVYDNYGIPETIDGGRFRIIPNPARDRFRIESSNILVAEITIYDVLGEVIYYSEDLSSTIDVSGQAAGVYVVMLKDGISCFRAKVLIQR